MLGLLTYALAIALLLTHIEARHLANQLCCMSVLGCSARLVGVAPYARAYGPECLPTYLVLPWSGSPAPMQCIPGCRHACSAGDAGAWCMHSSRPATLQLPFSSALPLSRIPSMGTLPCAYGLAQPCCQAAQGCCSISEVNSVVLRPSCGSIG